MNLADPIAAANVAQLAELAAVDVVALGEFLACHRGGADVAESVARLTQFSRSTMGAAHEARRNQPRRRAGIVLQVEGLVASGAARNKAHAFELIARGGAHGRPVEPRTIANAYFKARKQTGRDGDS